MRVICHIGHHKTGTTSLQAFLAQNSYKLLEKGIYYPWVESQGASYAFEKAFEQADKHEILPFNIREAHNALAFRMLSDSVKTWEVPQIHPELPHTNQMLISLHNQLSTMQPETTVLVSEVLSNFGKANPNLIPKLRHGLRSAEQFRLWCTLRRPDDYIVSWHAQMTKMGIRHRPFKDLDNGINFSNIHFNYRVLVEPWLSNIDDCEFTLRSYSDVMDNGGAVGDFFSFLSVDEARFIPVERMNQSIAPGAISIITEINDRFGRAESAGIRQRLQSIASNLDLYSSKEVEVIGHVQRENMFQRFKPIHKWLSDTAGVGSFFPDIEDMLICKPVSEEEARRQFLDLLTDEDISQFENKTACEVLTNLKRR